MSTERVIIQRGVVEALTAELTALFREVKIGDFQNDPSTVLGGLSTLAASYLAKARGSGEPELSTARAKDLEKFKRECEAFIEDYGHEHGHSHDQRINELRAQFEMLLGNGDK